MGEWGRHRVLGGGLWGRNEPRFARGILLEKKRFAWGIFLEGRRARLGNITELMSCSRRGARTTTWPILEIAPTNPKDVLN